MKNNISMEILISSILGFFTYLIGGIDSLMLSLLVLITIDYITGLCKGIVKKKLSSNISVRGIIKKFGYIVIIIIATLFDRLVSDDNMAIRTMMIYFFIANESLSILENWAIIGLPLPKKIFEIFENLRNESWFLIKNNLV